jgi:lysozyme family protein
MSDHLRPIRSSSSRRTFVAGAAATGLAATAGLGLGLAGLPANAIAQLVKVEDWQQLAQMVDEARKLGINTPLVTAPPKGDARFDEILPAAVDLIDDIDDAPDALKAKAQPIKARAKKLLEDLSRRERVPRRAEAEPYGWLAAFITAANAQDRETEERYLKYKDSYPKLFETCKVRPDRANQIEWYVNKITSAKYRTQYEKLEDDICVPWWVIGVLHALEATFNFDTHLHNGDPLTARTYHVPAGYPKTGSPPFTWAESAKDALDIKKWNNRTDWHLASTLYRIERFNGFRSREIYGINSPYLWSFSNHYTKGKFVADNVWDGNAVSNQCGAAVILRVLTDRKLIQMVA